MNEKPDPRNRLIADLFHDDWEKGSAGDFARMAALQVRRHRARQRTFLAAALTASAAVALMILLIRTDIHSGAKPNLASPAQAAASHPGYEVISDDELISDLRDRPLLILGNREAGRKFVLLQP